LLQKMLKVLAVGILLNVAAARRIHTSKDARLEDADNTLQTNNTLQTTAPWVNDPSTGFWMQHPERTVTKDKFEYPMTGLFGMNGKAHEVSDYLSPGGQELLSVLQDMNNERFDKVLQTLQFMEVIGPQPDKKTGVTYYSVKLMIDPPLFYPTKPDTYPYVSSCSIAFIKMRYNDFKWLVEYPGIRELISQDLPGTRGVLGRVASLFDSEADAHAFQHDEERRAFFSSVFAKVFAQLGGKNGLPAGVVRPSDVRWSIMSSFFQADHNEALRAKVPDLYDCQRPWGRATSETF